MPDVGIRSASPGTLMVTGVLDFDSAAEALKRAAKALKRTPHDTLDLAGVTAADSAGLACVLAMLATARRQGSALRVTHMPASLSALAKVCEVDSLLV